MLHCSAGCTKHVQARSGEARNMLWQREHRVTLPCITSSSRGVVSTLDLSAQGVCRALACVSSSSMARLRSLLRAALARLASTRRMRFEMRPFVPPVSWAEASTGVAQISAGACGPALLVLPAAGREEVNGNVKIVNKHSCRLSCCWSHRKCGSRTGPSTCDQR